MNSGFLLRGAKRFLAGVRGLYASQSASLGYRALQKFGFCHRSNSPPFDVDLYVLIIRVFSRIIKPILRGYIILKWFSVILENARQCLAN